MTVFSYMFPDKSVRQAQIYSPNPKLPLLLCSHCAIQDLQHRCKNTLLFTKNHCKCLVGWETQLHWPSGKTIKYLALVGAHHSVSTLCNHGDQQTERLGSHFRCRAHELNSFDGENGKQLFKELGSKIPMK